MEGGEDGGERDEEEFEGEGGSAGCRGDSGIGAKTGWRIDGCRPLSSSEESSSTKNAVSAVLSCGASAGSA